MKPYFIVSYLHSDLGAQVDLSAGVDREVAGVPVRQQHGLRSADPHQAPPVPP